jgi:hypothetical protein
MFSFFRDINILPMTRTSIPRRPLRTNRIRPLQESRVLRAETTLSARLGSHTIERLPSALGPPFHAALKPTNDRAVSDGRRGTSAKGRLIGDFFDRTSSLSDLRLVIRKELRNIIRPERRPPVRAIHYKGPLAAELVPDSVSSTDRPRASPAAACT